MSRVQGFPVIPDTGFSESIVGLRKRLLRNAGNGLPTACLLPPGAAPSFTKSRVLPGGDGLWVLCAALAYFCVAIFLHFVSFQICAPGNTLNPLGKFLPTGHLKRNGPPRRNEMPSRNARGNRRRGRAGICAIPAVKKSSGGPAWPAAKKPLRATWRAPVLPAVRRSGGCRRMSPCPETPSPFCGSGPADRGVDQGVRFYRSRPMPGATPLLPGQDRVPTARETGMDVVPCIRSPGLPVSRMSGAPRILLLTRAWPNMQAGTGTCSGPGRGIARPRVSSGQMSGCRWLMTGLTCAGPVRPVTPPQARPGTTPWTALPCPPS